MYLKLIELLNLFFKMQTFLFSYIFIILGKKKEMEFVFYHVTQLKKIWHHYKYLFDIYE